MGARYSAAVVGGTNMDIGGSAAGVLRLRDSNIGTISIRPGGVGRNIAHDLRLLGLEVSLATAVGGDLFGSGLLESCRALGMDMSLARVVPEANSSCYVYLNDGSGDMFAAVNDMSVTREISPAYLSRCIERINRCGAVVIDANLPEDTIVYLASNCTSPMYADPVSAAKAARLRAVLPRLAALKPNALEAQTLTGEDDPEKAALALVKMGVERVLVSLGDKGLIAAQRDGLVRLPCEKVKAVNTTGAGDAATAAMVWAGLRGLSLEETARMAVKAGALTCMSEDANSERLKELLI